MPKAATQLQKVDDAIRDAFTHAHENWKNWQSVFEHTGGIATNPLLADPGTLFVKFLREYSVGRTIRKNTKHDLRREIVRSSAFKKALTDESGRSLEGLERELRKRYGARNRLRGRRPGSIVSALSKIAAFLRPAQFTAWDRFGKMGINRVLGRADSSKFDGYATYLSDFNTLWDGEQGKQIRAYAASRRMQAGFEGDPRFLRRVLDCYLMGRGGQWAR